MSSQEETREAILNAAWQMMREDASRATLANIASAAGVSRQTLYLHFEGRAGLLLAMVRWVDERERFAEKVSAVSSMGEPVSRLAAYVRIWLDYLPRLHPVPGVLARAKADPAARSAWEDRMGALEGLYAEALRGVRRSGALRKGLTVPAAVQLVRAIVSVHAWEQLTVDEQWSQSRTVEALWNAVAGAVLTPAEGLSKAL